MNQLLKIFLRGERMFKRNEHLNNLPIWSCNYTRAAIPSEANYTDATANGRHAPKRNSIDTLVRYYSKNYNNKEPHIQSVLLSKTLTSRRTRRKKLREALEDRQIRFQRGVETALEERRIALTNTRRKIQERGKLIMQDIKETKEKVKGKIEEVIEKENIYTIPNLLCVTRIGLSPLLAYLIVSEKFGYALVFMTAAGVSDWIDGWIARNYKSQSSKIGSFLDPMADKVLIGTLFISLTYVDLIPVALTALIIGRDIILIISGFVIRYRSLPPPRTLSRYFDATHATAQLAPTFISKVNTGVQLALVATTLASPIVGGVNHEVLQILWYVTASSTVAAACSYIFSKETYRYLKINKKNPQERQRKINM